MGVVDVVSNGYHPSNPSVVADLETPTTFGINEFRSVTYNFLRMACRPEHCVVRCVNGSAVDTLTVEGSREGRFWTRISRSFLVLSMRDGYCVAESALDAWGEYRLLRLSTTSRHDVDIAAWEVYGTLLDAGRNPSGDSDGGDSSGSIPDPPEFRPRMEDVFTGMSSSVSIGSIDLHGYSGDDVEETSTGSAGL
jgi:hypothetical protein